jgi:23S rRNA pseudouridine2605 synthase
VSSDRLQKIIASAGLASRRTAEEWIRQGRVSVNGEVARLGAKADPEHDAILVDGKRLRDAGPQSYFLLNKPSGCVTSLSDPEGRPTVLDLIAPRHRKGLRPAGRLDFDSEGLLVLTTDGDLINKITHPRHGCVKTYAVKVKGLPAETQIERLRQGIVLDGKRTAPVEIVLKHKPRQGKGEKNSWWTVRLTEGRRRQIREMFFRIGHPVQRLMRVAIGDVSDPQLRVGSYRRLDAEEIRSLRGEQAPTKGRGKGMSRR